MEKFKNILIDCRVDIQLNSGERYTGTFQTYNEKFKFVQLTGISEFEGGVKLCGAQRFYETEIATIAEEGANSKAVHSIESVESSKSEPRNERRSEIEESYETFISDAELEEIDKKIRSSVHINQCDSTYHAALDDLRRQEIVGINIESAHLGRLRNGSLLSFSTNDNIYLFDLMHLGRILPELKCILEAEKPRKVVHNSCFIVDQLKHCYKCQLNGILDTMIMHFLIRKNKKAVSFAQCLNEYFKLGLESKKKFNWHNRPLDDLHKTAAAFNVAYLIKLYFHMSLDVLQRPLRQMTDDYSKTFSQCDDIVEVYDEITNHRNPGLAGIDINAFDLNALTLNDLPDEIK